MSNSVSKLLLSLHQPRCNGNQLTRLPQKTLFLAVALLFAPSAQSEQTSEAERCLPELIAAPQAIPEMQANPESAPKHVEADRLKQISENQFQLQGKTTLKQPGLVVLSDTVTLDRKQNTADFEGHVELHQQEVTITADKAMIDGNAKKARLENTRYQLQPSRAHGKSTSIRLDENKQTIDLQRASLTTCKIKSDQSVDWDLKFDNLQINDKTRRVIGKNTTLYFNDVPIFYTPYFDYPLDDRATGLLVPDFGSYKSVTDDERKSYVKIPYYFNIAPNMDDTLTLIPISERGLGVDNEFRYIAKNHDVLHSAELTLTAIHDNMVADQGLASMDLAGNISYGDKDADRWRAKLKANQNWGHGFSSTIDWQEVSDEVFFKEIPVEQELKNATIQQRYARFDYRNGNLHSYARVLSYLRLQNAAINYEKRPELGLSYYKNLSQFDFDITANLSDFYVPVSDHTRPEGARFHLQPQLSHRIQKSYGYLNTTLVANLTQYQMDDNGYNPSEELSFNRSVPQFAIRGGLIFERDIKFGGQTYIQTLEPEIQYLYTPYVDQSDIALFDTAVQSLAFSNLFSMNRFTGADRIGDANQVSMALSTKLLDANGRQLADAGIGQIAYLQDRKVALRGTTPQTEKYSDLFVKLGITLNNWYFASTSQFDRDELTMTNANSRLKWQDGTHLLMLNHTLQNVDTSYETDMVSIGAYSKISSDWELGFFRNYNLQTEKIYETQVGLRYDSCCWAAEIVAERTQLENGLYNDGIQIQFELKGLSTSSSRFRKELTDKLDF